MYMHMQQLDPDEYLHLAIHASSVGDHHACMSYLKEVLQRQPAHASALYLLAAQHAELGLLERAISGMKAALAITPELEIARLQLGLLLLDRDRAGEAKQQLSALDGSSNPALRAFSQALLALADADLRAAQEKLALGLALPSGNPALSAMMQRIFDQLAKKHAAAVEPPASAPESAPLFLGAYRQASSS